MSFASTYATLGSIHCRPIGHSGTALPENFYDFIPRRVHGLLAKLLMALVLLHVAGALYHQFVQRDGLMARMGFGKR